MITVIKLAKHYGSSQALKGVTFDVPEGSLLAITGKSGSGKSTLLTLLAGLEKPSNGSIAIADQEITSLSERRLTRFRRQNIGFIFQSFNLIPNLSALENVMLPMEFAKISRKKRVERASNLLEQVGITGSKQRRLPSRLSGGEQQRVAIARALANKPNIILADEPTGNLDSQNSARIFKLLRSLAKDEHVTVILVTHDQNLANECEQQVILSDGQLAGNSYATSSTNHAQ